MVIRNGWYVCKVKYPKPSLMSIIKWNLTALLLMIITFIGVFTSSKKMDALAEGFGRLIGWISLIFIKPTVEK